MTPAAWERPRPHPALPSKLASERSKEGKREGGREGQSRRKKSEERKKRGYFRARPRPLSLVTAPVRNLRSLHFKSGQVNVPTHHRAERRWRKRVRKNKRMQTAASTAPRPSPSPWTEPTSFRDPSVRPSIRGYSECESPSLAPAPTPAYLSARGRACLRAWSESFTLDGWLLALPCPCHLLHSAWRPGRQAGRPSFTPQFLAPSRPRAPLWRKCLPTIGLRRCRRRRLPSNRGLQWTHADSNAVAATLAGRQSSPTPLCNMVL